MNRRRSFGRCPHCGRTVWTEPLCPRPHLVNGLAVHQHCYRLLTAPHAPEPAPGTPTAALNTHPA